MKNEIKRSLLLAGIFIFLFLFINIVLSSVLFIFKISISKFIAPISLILTIIIITLFLFLLKMIALKKIYNFIISIIFPILIIILAIVLNGKVIDHSYDGNTYHKATIGLLAEGWNPVYQTADEFDNQNNEKIYIDGNEISIWVNHYAKATHIFQANIYTLTGNIESGKSINTLSIIALFLVLFSFLSIKFNKTIFPFLFSLCTITPSVVCAQFLTNYIDFLLYIYMILILLSFFIIEYRHNKFELVIGMTLFIIALIMMINIKFTSFAYAGIFCLGYYIYFIFKLHNKNMTKRFFKAFTLTAAISVIIGIFIVGLSVYPKNFINKGNPFYPLFGEGKQDIITFNQPYYFEDKTAIEKYSIAMFSKVSNIVRADETEAEWKIPFTFDHQEILNIGAVDTRISGNGVLFGGIFAVSLVMLIFLSIKIYKMDKKIFILCTIPLVITIGMIFMLNESWWARYFPQTYLITLIDILYLYILKSKIFKGIMLGLITLILINNFITFYSSVKYHYELNVSTNDQIRILKENIDAECQKIVISAPTFLGAIYNIKDELKNYNIDIRLESTNKLTEYNTIMNSFIYWKWESNE